MDLSRKKLFLLDMDGTLYLDDALFDGAAEFLAHVRKTGGTYLYLTNNSSRGADAYVDKMRRLGIDAAPEDFLTSADAAIRYLQQAKSPEDVYYVCGTESFKRQLRLSGFTLAESPEERVTTVLAGFDTELTFRKLEDCCILLRRGADFIATNPDWVCPTWYGSVPDCGSVCEMLHRATGRSPRVIGKPQPEMVYLALERTGCAPEDAVLVGDRLYTDIACGVNAGIDTVFVLSGEGTVDDLARSDVRPSLVLDNIAALLAALQE